MLNSSRASQDAQTDDSNQAAAVAILAKFATVTNAILALVLIVGMVIEQYSVTLSVLSGIGYYALTTTPIIALLSGTVKEVAIEALRQHTEQEKHKLMLKALMHAQPAQAPHGLSVLPTEDFSLPAYEPLQITANYVPAVAEEEHDARREAIKWVLPLYGHDGRPDKNKVNLSDNSKGRVWVKNPSEEAISYLSHKGIISDLGNGIQLNTDTCPTINDAKQRLRR